MAIINGLFALASLIFFILMIVGLIKPSWVKMQSRLKSFAIFFLGMIISAIIFDATMSDEDRAKQEAQRKIVEQKIEQTENNPNEQDNEPKQEKLESTDVVEQDASKEPLQQIDNEIKLTNSQRNAIRSAEQYLNISGFSRNGLIEQLSSSYGDGYNKQDAIIAVDSLNVDWNKQAARSAQQYLSISGFSCNGLIEQLSADAGDKYTKSQAKFGAQQAGACS